MVKIKLYGVRDEEVSMAQAWSQTNGVEISMTKEMLSPDNVSQAEGFDGVSLSQVGQLDASIYPTLKDMGIKQIAQRSAGVDMYDLQLAKENDIIITNVPSYSPESIAEWSVTVALNLIRHYNLIQERVRQQNFSWTPEIRGRVIGDMTVAVIGTGRIGQCVAKFFHGFGCKIVGYDLYPNEGIKSILEYKDSIEEAIKDADIVSLHMPATAETHHMFNYDMLKKFKKDAIILNMARGALIKTEDLFKVLDEGHLFGAGLDTYEFEGPLIPKNLSSETIEDEVFKQVLNHERIIYSPHIAFYTDEAVKNLVEGGLNATLDVIQTGDSKQRVN